MNRVEYTQQPELFRLFNLPNGKTKIEMRENIISEQRKTDEGTQTVWTADEYALTRTYRAGLAADVATNYAAYLADAKAEEAVRHTADEYEQYLREMNGQLVDTLLDYDFRLMMLEEIGNI